MIEKDKLKRQILVVLSFCVSVGLIFWLLARIDYEQTIKIIRQSRWQYLVLAFCFTMCIPICSVIRWKGVLRSQKNISISHFEALRMIMVASILNSFLPSKAGDMAKAVFIRKQCGLTSGVGMTAIERLIDLMVLGLLGIVGFIWSGLYYGMAGGSILVCGVVVIFVLALILPTEKLPVPKKYRQIANDFISTFREWSTNFGAVSQTLAGSLGSWSLSGLTICSLGSAFCRDSEWGTMLSIFPVAILAGLIPVTISGVGTRDAVFVLLLSNHILVEEATLIGLGYTFLGYWFLAVLGLFLFGWKIKHLYRREESYESS